MTGPDAPPDRPTDLADEPIHRRLEDAFRAARATTPRPDHHAFLATAQVRRDRLRRRRRTWTVTVPIVAATLVLVAIGVITTLRDDTSMHTTNRTSLQFTAVDGSPGAATCPPASEGSNTEPGEPIFDFTPDRLIICTYGVDGRLITLSTVPGDDQPGVDETVAYLQEAYVDRSTGSEEPHCAAGEIAVNRVAVRATADDRDETAWIVMAGCTTVDDRSEQDGAPETGTATADTDGTIIFHGAFADVRVTPSGDSMTVRIRPSGADEYGEPLPTDGPHPSDAWTDTTFGLDDVTIHLVVLPERSFVVDPGAAAGLQVGSSSCGPFECIVYEVPRDGDGPPAELQIDSDVGTTSITLDQVPVGESGLSFHFDGG